MNRNEISELRRRLNPEKNNIPEILGCYVDTKGEIISSFRRPLISMPQEECEKYLNIFRKTLSGTPGKNLIDVEFYPYDVMNSENHKALMHLRETGLKDEEAVQDLFARIISALKMETNYLILLLCDSYDVPFKGRDDVKVDDASEEVFNYFLCCVCPVVTGKTELGYRHDDKRFHNAVISQMLKPPVLGFLYPAFDDRCTNIYGALLYSRNAQENHAAFVNAVFNRPAPMTAPEQKDCFDQLLSDAMDARCSFEVMQNLNQQLCDKLAAHKESGSPEVLSFTAEEMGELLEDSGSAPEQAEAFIHSCEERLGKDAAILPANVCNPRKMTVETEQIKISLDPQYSYLIKTKKENCRKYIIISADAGVEINGVPVEIE